MIGDRQEERLNDKDKDAALFVRQPDESSLIPNYRIFQKNFTRDGHSASLMPQATESLTHDRSQKCHVCKRVYHRS